MSVSDRSPWVFVTGGTCGIGEAVVADRLRAGWRVATCHDVADPPAHRLVAQGLQARAVSVTDPAMLRSWVSELARSWGPCNALVANAGIGGASAVFELGDDLWDRVLDTNLNGVFHSIQAVLPSMREVGGGSIVVISSVGARLCHAGAAHYCASKAGAEAVVRVLARELAPAIRVNAVAPGLVDTRLYRASSNRAVLEAQAESVPLKRIAGPSEIAAVVAFLMSDASAYVTGSVIDVSGGL